MKVKLLSRTAKRMTVIAVLLTSAAAPLSAFAQNTQSFSDVPASSPDYEAVEFLKSKGMIQGYSDGTFKPGQGVTRAEALKIIVAPLLTDQSKAALTSTTFSDIPAGVWYLPYAEAARQNKIIDGPPTTKAFHGGDPVLKAQFLKMLFIAYKLDPAAVGSDFVFPLSGDVQDSKQWYYPIMRLGLASSVVSISQDGLLHPEKKLTRSDVAQFLYAFLQSRDGKRESVQINVAQTELVNVQKMITAQNLSQAIYATARALLAARGAVGSKPDDADAQATLKATQAFALLVDTYSSGVSGKFQEAVDNAGKAWKLAETLPTPSMQPAKDYIQKTAQAFAAEARKDLAGQTQP